MAQSTTRQTLREEASSDLKLRFRGTGTGSSGTAITVVEYSDLFTEARAPLAAYLAATGSEDFRRVETFDETTGAITLNRASVPDGAVDLYFILTPVDWNEAINRALASLFFTDEFELALTSGQSLYPFTGQDWLQVKHQVEGVFWQYETGTPVWTQRTPVATYDLIQDANAVQINVGALPTDLTDLKLIIEGRHYYEALASDAATTTCPKELALAQTKVNALRRAWAIMGERAAKEMFGQEMRDAEADLLDKKKQHVQQVRPSDNHVREAQLGPELAMPTGFRW